jgi:hypothetical protein
MGLVPHAKKAWTRIHAERPPEMEYRKEFGKKKIPIEPIVFI